MHVREVECHASTNEKFMCLHFAQSENGLSRARVVFTFVWMFAQQEIYRLFKSKDISLVKIRNKIKLPNLRSIGSSKPCVFTKMILTLIAIIHEWFLWRSLRFYCSFNETFKLNEGIKMYLKSFLKTSIVVPTPHLLSE